MLILQRKSKEKISLKKQKQKPLTDCSLNKLEADEK